MCMGGKFEKEIRTVEFRLRINNISFIWKFLTVRPSPMVELRLTEVEGINVRNKKKNIQKKILGILDSLISPFV